MARRNGKPQVSATDIEEYLQGILYPTDRAALVEFARETGAPDFVVVTLSRLPDAPYDSLREVSLAMEGLD